MKPIEVFSSKAALYAKYRWSYAPEAIEDICAFTDLSQESTLADIGAGTGILTREFAGKVGKIYAIEPNPEMRSQLIAELGNDPSCTILGARAEATTLASNSIDVITVGQAVDWFDPKKARAEFYRVLKPGGWIVLCRNRGNDPVLGAALSGVFLAETDTESLMIGKTKPRSFYFGDGGFNKKEYPNRKQETWEAFFGGLSSASFAPDEGSRFYDAFERNARRVFKQFSAGGLIEIKAVTELYLGKINTP